MTAVQLDENKNVIEAQWFINISFLCSSDRHYHKPPLLTSHLPQIIVIIVINTEIASIQIRLYMV